MGDFGVLDLLGVVTLGDDMGGFLLMNSRSTGYFQIASNFYL
jgi:hypothetical protein